jgi:hypothetical protein
MNLRFASVVVACFATGVSGCGGGSGGSGSNPGGPDDGGGDAGATPEAGVDAPPDVSDAGGSTPDVVTKDAPNNAGPPVWAAPVAYPIGTQPDGFIGNAAADGIRAADVNGDGHPDLVVLHIIDDTMNVLLNKGDGTFSAAVAYKVPGPIHSLFVADFNGDGKLDAAVPGGQTQANGFAATITVVLGKGDGTFGAPITSADLGTSRGTAIADFNGDGKLDFVSNDVGAGIVNVAIGKGDGTFEAVIPSPKMSSFGYSRWVAAGDLNGDGKIDVAIADGQGVQNMTGTCEATTLFGQGDGTFVLGAHYPSPPTAQSWQGAPPPVMNGPTVNPEDIYAVDVNNDGKLDLVESLYDHNIDVFIGKGDGTFAAAVGYVTGEYPRCVVTTDFDLDGITDLAVVNVGCAPGTGSCMQSNGSVAIMLGNGGGTFQAPALLKPTVYPEWAAAADFNGDGRPDLAVTEVLGGHSLYVLMNK